MSKTKIVVVPIQFSNFEDLMKANVGIKGQSEVIDYLIGRVNGDRENQPLEGIYYFAGLIESCLAEKGMLIYEFEYKKERRGTEDEVNVDISDIAMSDIKMSPLKILDKYCKKLIQLHSWADQNYK